MRLAPIFAVVAMVSACAVGPDYQRPEVDVSEQWTEIGAAEMMDSVPDAPVSWWQVFDDPLLDELVNEAYRQNLDIEVAGLRIMEARAALGIALGNRFPQEQNVRGGVLGTGLSENSANFFPFADSRYWSADLGFDVGWELDFWGRFRRGVEAAQADLATSLAGYDGVLVTVTAETARAYVVIRTLQQLLRVTKENVDLQRRSYEIADVLARNERVTELDVEQATTLLESTAAQVPVIEARLAQAKNALSVLLGQSPGQLDSRLGTGPVPDPPAQVAVGVPAELLRRRPDVLAAELRAAAQSARVGIAESERYPRLGLTGSIGLRAADTGTSSLDDLFSSDSIEFVGGPVFSWPILNYGRIKNSVRVQDARLQQSLISYQNSVLSAAREVEDAIVSHVRQREALEFLGRSAAAARRSVDLALLQYRESIVDYQRVLDTQRELNAQQQLFVQTKGEVATSLVLLYKALGGGWEIRSGNPVVDQDNADQMMQRTNWGELLKPAEVPDKVSLPAPASEQPLFGSPD
ncbi:MAG: efflux transporter outer membrane subunit [Gammaproteobacteria bacterium]